MGTALDDLLFIKIPIRTTKAFRSFIRSCVQALVSNDAHRIPRRIHDIITQTTGAIRLNEQRGAVQEKHEKKHECTGKNGECYSDAERAELRSTVHDDRKSTRSRTTYTVSTVRIQFYQIKSNQKMWFSK